MNGLETRFRGWNPNQNFYMFYDFDINKLVPILGSSYIPESLIFEEWTGLKDKNEKLLYEGF